MHHLQETVYTIYTMVTLSYSLAEMPFCVTIGNAYTELQAFARKLKSTIGKTNWTGYFAEYIVNPSKAINHREMQK